MIHLYRFPFCSSNILIQKREDPYAAFPLKQLLYIFLFDFNIIGFEPRVDLAEIGEQLRSFHELSEPRAGKR
ncbi:hypothetical protein SAMN04488054_103311 [Salibacterium qingdaonense]|uniref:Uncharacterized protein n=1 Tax=Salibacterium qingdaonense TaxID=266892 RepID=A0A1I4JS65_9BACI|nr:hypothetical protein SAMN04488054_103311 [Salibacterium qingdaonense]